MGERVTCIEMQAFRGVREKLTLEFPRGASAVLLGENATGKSTVADALEWYFTGEIGLLRHEGRAASLRHVDARSCDATSVTLQTTGALGGTWSLITHRQRKCAQRDGRRFFSGAGR